MRDRPSLVLFGFPFGMPAPPPISCKPSLAYARRLCLTIGVSAAIFVALNNHFRPPVPLHVKSCSLS